MKVLKVLVACEESQAVCKAFRELGHEAYSCDILPCSGGSKKADGTHRSANARASTFRDSKTKSKTFPGIAKAMATQWSKFILEQEGENKC